MYLVLIALLAINVSRDVIDAFRLVNDSVLETNTNLTKKLEDTYASFERNYEFNPQKVTPYWEKAIVARQLSEEIIGEIEKLRYEVIAKTENISEDSARKVTISMIKNKDNNTEPTSFFLGDNFDKGSSRAHHLKKQINEYRTKMLALVDPKYFDQVSIGLNTDGPYYNADGMKESWEIHFFYHTILVADLTILNKLKNDILNAQFDVVNLLHKSIGQGDFKFDKVTAKVIPQASYVFAGESFRAQVIAAAYDTTQMPEVYYTYGDDSLTVARTKKEAMIEAGSENMMLQLPADREGRKYYKGFVRVKTATQAINDYPFRGDYYVATPSYSVSAKKMNVFYAGVDNPVSIAVSGVSKDKIFPSISCGAIRYDSGSKDWIVNVGSQCNNAFIVISAVVDGVRKEMGMQQFRVKKLPTPQPAIAGKRSGIISREQLIKSGGITVKMPEDFEFDHTFKVQSYTLVIKRGFNEYKYTSDSHRLTDEMKKQVARTNRGQDILFKDIVVISGDDDERTLSPIILTIN